MSPSSEEDKPEFADASGATSDSEATASNASESDVTPASDAADAPAEDEAETEEAAGEEASPATAENRKRRRLRRGVKAKRDDAKKPAAAPRRRRSARKPGEPLPVVRAQAKYVRSSARKARLVCDHIRGKSVEDARAILAHTPRAVARDWSKLLESAVANAEHNHELVGEDLYVKVVQADEGPTIKRHRPRAQGRATQIRKRTAHLTILLTPKD
jgi:ribosomal protein L22